MRICRSSIAQQEMCLGHVGEVKTIVQLNVQRELIQSINPHFVNEMNRLNNFLIFELAFGYKLGQKSNLINYILENCFKIKLRQILNSPTIIVCFNSR